MKVNDSVVASHIQKVFDQQLCDAVPFRVQFLVSQRQQGFVLDRITMYPKTF